MKQHFSIFSQIAFAPESFQGLRGVQSGGQQDLVGMVDFADPFAREAAALQSHGVQPVGLASRRATVLEKGSTSWVMIVPPPI